MKQKGILKYIPVLMLKDPKVIHLSWHYQKKRDKLKHKHFNDYINEFS